jgi:hypothetical protein
MSSSEDDEANEAMKALARIFSDPKLTAKAHFRCSVDGPTEIDELFESIMDETFGPHPRSRYKRWVGRLYRLGLIPKVPEGWVDEPEGKENVGEAGSQATIASGENQTFRFPRHLAISTS